VGATGFVVVVAAGTNDTSSSRKRYSLELESRATLHASRCAIAHASPPFLSGLLHQGFLDLIFQLNRPYTPGDSQLTNLQSVSIFESLLNSEPRHSSRLYPS
jgi:hypothetical protein